MRCAQTRLYRDMAGVGEMEVFATPHKVVGEINGLELEWVCGGHCVDRAKGRCGCVQIECEFESKRLEVYIVPK